MGSSSARPTKGGVIAAPPKGNDMKDAILQARLHPEVKAKAVKRAEEEGRSLTNYITRLIIQDAAKERAA